MEDPSSSALDPSQSALFHSVEWEDKVAVLQGSLGAKTDLLAKLTTENKLLQSHLQSTRLELNSTTTTMTQAQHELDRLRGDNNNLLELVSKLEATNNALQQDYISKLEHEHSVNTKMRELSLRMAIDSADRPGGAGSETSSVGGRIGFAYVDGRLQPIDPTHVTELQQRLQKVEQRLQQRHAAYEELLSKFETQHLASKTASLDLRAKLTHEVNLNSTLKQQYALLQKNYRETAQTIAAHNQSMQTLQAAYDALLLDFNTAAMKLQHTEEREKHAVNRGDVLEQQAAAMMRSEAELRTQLQQLKTTNANYEYEYNKLSKVYAVLRTQYDDKNAALYDLVIKNKLAVHENDYQTSIDAAIRQHCTKFITNAELEAILQAHGGASSGDSVPQHIQHQLSATQSYTMDSLYQLIVRHFETVYNLRSSTSSTSSSPTTDPTSSTKPPSDDPLANTGADGGSGTHVDDAQPIILMENGLIMTPAGLTISIPVLYRQHTELLGEHRDLLEHHDQNSHQLLNIRAKMTNILTDMQAKLDQSKEADRRKHQEEIDRLHAVIRARDEELEVTKRNKTQLSQQLQVLIRSKVGSNNSHEGLLAEVFRLQTQNANLQSQHDEVAAKLAAANAEIEQLGTDQAKLTDELKAAKAAAAAAVLPAATGAVGAPSTDFAGGVAAPGLAQSPYRRRSVAGSLQDLNTTLGGPGKDLMNTTLNTTMTHNPADPNPWQLELSTAQATVQSQQAQLVQLNSTVEQNANTIATLSQQVDSLKFENGKLEGKLAVADEVSKQLTEKSQAYFFELSSLKSSLATLQFQFNQQRDQLATASAGLDKALGDKIGLQAEILSLKTQLSNLTHDLGLAQTQYDDLSSIYKLAKADLDAELAKETRFDDQLVKITTQHQTQVQQLLDKIQDLSSQREELLVKFQSGFSTPMEYRGHGQGLHTQTHPLSRHLRHQPLSLHNGSQARSHAPARPSSAATALSSPSSSPSSSSSSVSGSPQPGDCDLPPPLPLQTPSRFRHRPGTENETQTQQFSAIGESIVLREQLRSTRERCAQLESSYNSTQAQLRALQESMNGEKLALRGQLLEQQQLVATLKSEKQALEACVDQLKIKVRAVITHRLYQAGVLAKPAAGATATTNNTTTTTTSDPTTSTSPTTPTPSAAATAISNTIAGLTSTSAPAAAATTTPDSEEHISLSISQLEDMIALAAQTKPLQTQVLSQQTELELVTASLKSTTQAHSALQSKHSALEETFAALNAEFTTGKERIAELTTALDKEIAEHSAKTTQFTDLSQNFLLLQAQYNTVTEERNKLQAEVKSTFEALTQGRSDLELKKIDLANASKQLEEARAQLATLGAAHQAAQNELTATTATLGAKLTRLETDLEAANTKLAQKDALLASLESEVKQFVVDKAHTGVEFDKLLDNYSKLEAAHSSVSTELTNLRDGLGAGPIGSFDSFGASGAGSGAGAAATKSARKGTSDEFEGADYEQLVASLRLDKDELAQQVDSYRLQLDQLQGTNEHSAQHLEAVQSQLSSISGLYSSLQDAHDDLKAKLARATTELEHLTAANERLTQQAAGLQDQNDKISSEMAETAQKQLETETKAGYSSGTASGCSTCTELEVKLGVQQSVTAQRTEQLAALHKQYKVLFDAKYLIAKEAVAPAAADSSADATAMEDDSSAAVANKEVKQRQYVLELLKMESKLKKMLVREDIETQEMAQIHAELAQNRTKLTAMVEEMELTRTQLAAATTEIETLEKTVAEMRSCQSSADAANTLLSSQHADLLAQLKSKDQQLVEMQQQAAEAADTANQDIDSTTVDDMSDQLPATASTTTLSPLDSHGSQDSAPVPTIAPLPDDTIGPQQLVVDQESRPSQVTRPVKRKTMVPTGHDSSDDSSGPRVTQPMKKAKTNQSTIASPIPPAEPAASATAVAPAPISQPNDDTNAEAEAKAADPAVSVDDEANDESATAMDDDHLVQLGVDVDTILSHQDGPDVTMSDPASAALDNAADTPVRPDTDKDISGPASPADSEAEQQTQADALADETDDKSEPIGEQVAVDESAEAGETAEAQVSAQDTEFTPAQDQDSASTAASESPSMGDDDDESPAASTNVDGEATETTALSEPAAHVPQEGDERNQDDSDLVMQDVDVETTPLSQDDLENIDETQFVETDAEAIDPPALSDQNQLLKPEDESQPADESNSMTDDLPPVGNDADSALVHRATQGDADDIDDAPDVSSAATTASDVTDLATVESDQQQSGPQCDDIEAFEQEIADELLRLQQESIRLDTLTENLDRTDAVQDDIPDEPMGSTDDQTADIEAPAQALGDLDHADVQSDRDSEPASHLDQDGAAESQEASPVEAVVLPLSTPASPMDDADADAAEFCDATNLETDLSAVAQHDASVEDQVVADELIADQDSTNSPTRPEPSVDADQALDESPHEAQIDASMGDSATDAPADNNTP